MVIPVDTGEAVVADEVVDEEDEELTIVDVALADGELLDLEVVEGLILDIEVVVTVESLLVELEVALDLRVVVEQALLAISR